MASYDYPGKVSIDRADVYNNLGKVSILNNLMQVEIYEDIYTPYVYCSLLVVDYNKLASELPLMGEESFVITFRSEGSRPITYVFYLYQQDRGAITSSNKAQGYLLHGVTLERAFDSAKTVAGAYKGSYASIAGQIYDDYIKKDTKLEFQFEGSKSIARYVVPQLTPLQAIDHCMRRAVPNSNVYSPYTFFRNSRGFNFISFNTLFQKAGNESEDVVHVFGRPSPDPQKDEDGVSGGLATRNDIISFEPQGKYNTVNKIDRGTYNMSSYSFDLTTKQYVLRKQFNLIESKKKFQLGNVGEFNTDEFLQTFKNSRCHVDYRPTDFSIEIEGTQTDFLPDAIGEMTSYLGLFAQQQVGVLMYGDSNYTAGQTITIQVYKPTDQNSTAERDDTHTGTYLISRMKHRIVFDTQNTYELHLTGVKGAMGDTMRGLQNNG